MAVFNCKIKGIVDSQKCFNCFDENLMKKKYDSRVICKYKNVEFAEGEINTENNIVDLVNIA